MSESSIGTSPIGPLQVHFNKDDADLTADSLRRVHNHFKNAEVLFYKNAQGDYYAIAAENRPKFWWTQFKAFIFRRKAPEYVNREIGLLLAEQFKGVGGEQLKAKMNTSWLKLKQPIRTAAFLKVITKDLQHRAGQILNRIDTEWTKVQAEQDNTNLPKPGAHDAVLYTTSKLAEMCNSGKYVTENIQTHAETLKLQQYSFWVALAQTRAAGEGPLADGAPERTREVIEASDWLEEQGVSPSTLGVLRAAGMVNNQTRDIWENRWIGSKRELVDALEFMADSYTQNRAASENEVKEYIAAPDTPAARHNAKRLKARYGELDSHLCYHELDTRLREINREFRELKSRAEAIHAEKEALARSIEDFIDEPGADTPASLAQRYCENPAVVREAKALQGRLKSLDNLSSLEDEQDRLSEIKQSFEHLRRRAPQLFIDWSNAASGTEKLSSRLIHTSKNHSSVADKQNWDTLSREVVELSNRIRQFDTNVPFAQQCETLEEMKRDLQGLQSLSIADKKSDERMLNLIEGRTALKQFFRRKVKDVDASVGFEDYMDDEVEFRIHSGKDRYRAELHTRPAERDSVLAAMLTQTPRPEQYGPPKMRVATLKQRLRTRLDQKLQRVTDETDTVWIGVHNVTVPDARKMDLALQEGLVTDPRIGGLLAEEFDAPVTIYRYIPDDQEIEQTNHRTIVANPQLIEESAKPLCLAMIGSQFFGIKLTKDGGSLE